MALLIVNVRLTFGLYEVDLQAGELWKAGFRIKLQGQPFKVLTALIERPGQVVSREELQLRLWGKDTIVDFDHSLGTAINKIREALGDKANNPRFVETLARRGYRFVAQVERIALQEDGSTTGPMAGLLEKPAAVAPDAKARLLDRVLSGPEDLPKSSHAVVQTLFLLLQLMYVGFYVGALANLAEIHDLISELPHSTLVFAILIVTAAILIPVRTFLLCAALFRAPGLRDKFLKLWWFLLPLDGLWSLSPFLLLHHINYGLALACMTLLLYSPFAQRSLLLIGAGDVEQKVSLPVR